MDDLERKLYATDFSKYTDLKSRLADKLFSRASSKKVTAFPFSRLSDDEAGLVNAAQGLPQTGADPTWINGDTDHK